MKAAAFLALACLLGASTAGCEGPRDPAPRADGGDEDSGESDDAGSVGQDALALRVSAVTYYRNLNSNGCSQPTTHTRLNATRVLTMAFHANAGCDAWLCQNDPSGTPVRTSWCKQNPNATPWTTGYKRISLLPEYRVGTSWEDGNEYAIWESQVQARTAAPPGTATVIGTMRWFQAPNTAFVQYFPASGGPSWVGSLKTAQVAAFIQKP